VCRLELGRSLAVGRLLESHVADHIAAALPRGIISNSSSLAYTTPMPVGPKILWPEKTRVATELLDVHRQMGNRLRSIDQHAGVVSLGHCVIWQPAELSKAVRGVRQGDQLGSRTEQPLILFEHDLAAVGDGNDPQDGPFSLAIICQGTMLAWCSSVERTISSPGCRNFLPYVCATRLIPSVAHGQRQFPWKTTLPETLHLLPRLLEGIGGSCRQSVRSAVDV